MPDILSPLISVIICTRDKGEQVKKTADSVLNNNYPSFELIIIDQSKDNVTEQSLNGLLQHTHFRYIRTPTEGRSTACNLGVLNTNGEIIVITDDDCEVMPDWIEEFVSAFNVHQRIGVVLGQVLSGDHDRTRGFIPAYFLKEPFLACTIKEKHRVEGIGACMGIRRATLAALRGFDECMGTGAPLKAGEDTDLVVRALLSGYYVYETPAIAVVHHGFRTWEEGNKLIKNYMYGFGAMFAKNLRSGHWRILVVMFHLARRWAFSDPVVNLGKRPPRFMRLAAFMKGAVAGALTPMNRDAVLFTTEKGGAR